MTFYLNYKDTSYWGPIYWNILHNLAKKVDKSSQETKNKFLYILKNFTTLIPCDDCSSTYMKTLGYAFELLSLNNVINEYYFQKLIYYLHLCVTVKKEEDTNLELFMDLIYRHKTIKEAYEILFPTIPFISFDIVLNLKPIDIQVFRMYYEKHMINKGDLKIYDQLILLIKQLFETKKVTSLR